MGVFVSFAALHARVQEHAETVSYSIETAKTSGGARRHGSLDQLPHAGSKATYRAERRTLVNVGSRPLVSSARRGTHTAQRVAMNTNYLSAGARRGLLFAVAASGIVVGCGGGSEVGSIGGEDSTAALSRTKIRLPTGDPCRSVLGPLVMGFAESVFGLSGVRNASVVLTTENTSRGYKVTINLPTATGQFHVELDNDSASRCLLLEAHIVMPGDAPTGRLRAATKRELDPTPVPVGITPANDECASVLRYLAEAAAVSAVGASNIDAMNVKLEQETTERRYGLQVDGKAFTVNGNTFPNDHAFSFSLNNDSFSKCLVYRVEKS